MKVIGVVGQNGSGKDEVLKYLNQRYGIPYIGTGDIVREIATSQGIEPTRANLRELSEQYFARYGKGHFIRMAIDRILQNRWKIAGISGIRSPEDVAILRDTLGKDFILIAVTVTDPEIRYHRMLRRGEERDRSSLDQLRKQDDAEERLFRISEAMNRADYTISNDSSLEDLHKAVDKVVQTSGVLQG